MSAAGGVRGRAGSEQTWVVSMSLAPFMGLLWSCMVVRQVERAALWVVRLRLRTGVCGGRQVVQQDASGFADFPGERDKTPPIIPSLQTNPYLILTPTYRPCPVLHLELNSSGCV